MSLATFVRSNARYLGAGFLLTFSSSYGQTYFIALFAGHIMVAYGLSDGEWGLIYTIGTTASAVVMFWAGALTDRFRVKSLGWFVMPGLAMVCLLMALNTSAALLIGIVFLLRFFGQGMMSQFASVSMARWFQARRGLALSISAMGFAAGQAAFPVIVAALFLVLDWRTVWMIAGAMMLLTMPVILTLLAHERTPQSLAESESSLGMGSRHWTRPEVLKSSFFWLLVPMLIGAPAWGTALFFQQVHIAQVKGWPLLDYLALIPLLTLVGVATTLFSGQAIDRFGSGKLMMLYPIPWCVAFFVMSGADTLAEVIPAFFIFGLGLGLQGTVVTAFWAEYFGTKHIGAIKAVSTSIMVFGSAVGPGVTGVLIDVGLSFPDQMLGLSIYFLVAAACVWLAVTRASRDLPPTKVNIERA